MEAGRAAAAEEPAPPLREDVDALVKTIESGGAFEGASPTVRVNRIVAVGDAKLRPVLEQALTIATTVPAARRHQAAARQLVRFLYALPEPSAQEMLEE